MWSKEGMLTYPSPDMATIARVAVRHPFLLECTLVGLMVDVAKVEYPLTVELGEPCKRSDPHP